MGAEMSWFGRQLLSYETDDKEISYVYDEDGLRTQKLVNGVEHNYYYVVIFLHKFSCISCTCLRGAGLILLSVIERQPLPFLLRVMQRNFFISIFVFSSD